MLAYIVHCKLATECYCKPARSTILLSLHCDALKIPMCSLWNYAPWHAVFVNSAQGNKWVLASAVCVTSSPHSPVFTAHSGCVCLPDVSSLVFSWAPSDVSHSHDCVVSFKGLAVTTQRQLMVAKKCLFFLSDTQLSSFYLVFFFSFVRTAVHK